MKQLSFLILIFCNLSLSAQSVFESVGASSKSVGGASVSINNIWSVFNNPSGFSNTRKSQIGIYSEQRYSEAKLTTSAIVLVVPSKFVNLGFGILHYGYSLFNQQKITFSITKELSKQFSLGVSLNYFGTSISEQERAHSFIGEIGLMYRVTSKLNTGMHLFNVNQARYGYYTSERLPTFANMGFNYMFSEKVSAIGETEMLLNHKSVFRGGLKYQFHEAVSLSVGFANNPILYSFGTAIKLKKYKIEYAASVYELLGVTHHVGLSCNLGK